MSYDKLNKEIEPPKELLTENQQWKYGKNGWRKCPIWSEEQKEQRKKTMSEIGKMGKKSQNDLMNKGKEMGEVEKTYQDKISKLEKEKEIIFETQQDVKALINEMKQLNQKVKEEPPKEQQPKEEPTIPKRNDQEPKEIPQIASQEQTAPKKIFKNPLLNKIYQ